MICDLQIGTKTTQTRSQRSVFFIFEFCFDFVPFGAPFLLLLGSLLDLKIHLKSILIFFKINLQQHNSQDHPKRPQGRSKRSQDRPRTPPRPSPDALRGAREAQKGPKRHQDAAPNGSKNIRRGPRTPEQQKCRTNFTVGRNARSD